jgi:hypothetical protein
MGPWIRSLDVEASNFEQRSCAPTASTLVRHHERLPRAFFFATS